MGKQVRVCLHTSNKKEAELTLIKVKAKKLAEAEAVNLAISEKKKLGFTWADAVILWAEKGLGTKDFVAVSQSEESILRRLTPKIQNTPVDRIDESTFEQFMPDSSPGYYNKYVSVINAILAYALKKKKMTIAVKLENKKFASKRVRWLKASEWAKLYAQLPSHLQPASMVSVFTGLRPANVLKMKWAWIDFEGRILTVPKEFVKTEVDIVIPLSGAMMEIFKAERGKHPEYVFTFLRPLGKKAIKRGLQPRLPKPFFSMGNAWREAVVRAGLGTWEYSTDELGNEHRHYNSDVVYYTLRHTWASWNLNQGMSDLELTRLGGWADGSKMVARYSHHDIDILRDAAESVTPFEGGGKVASVLKKG